MHTVSWRLSIFAMNKPYQIFISYTQKDGDIAGSLASKLDETGLRCFMADRSILAAAEWEPELREAMLASDSVLLLITPRSKDSLWVAAEAGAAWVLQKKLIPVLMFVEPQQLFEPIRKYQARVAETPEQIGALVRELRQISFATQEQVTVSVSDAGRTSPAHQAENFTDPSNWEALLKIGEWAIDPRRREVVGEGMYRYLLSQKSYGLTPFTVRCCLTFLELRPESSVNAVNAGIVLGWSIPRIARQYLHLQFSGDRLLLAQIGFRGGDEYLDYRHVDRGVPFVLQPHRSYELVVKVSSEVMEVQCDGQETYSVHLGQQIPIGRVGLRPWRSLMRCDRFEVSDDERAAS